MGVITNPKKAGVHPNNRRPSGAAALAESLDLHDLMHAMALGNRATRRLAQRNLRKRLKDQR